MPGRDLDLVTRLHHQRQNRCLRAHRRAIRHARPERAPRRLASRCAAEFPARGLDGLPPCRGREGAGMSIATGETVFAGEGDGLPVAPPDSEWRLVAANEHLDFSRRHVMETEQRIVRQAALIQNLERTGCAEMATIGRTLLHALQASLRAAHANVERRQGLLHQSNERCAPQPAPAAQRHGRRAAASTR